MKELEIKDIKTFLPPFSQQVHCNECEQHSVRAFSGDGHALYYCREHQAYWLESTVTCKDGIKKQIKNGVDD